MRENYIMPVVGQIYKNQNGREYCCLSNASYPNEEAAQRAVELGEHQANMVRMGDGWSFTAQSAPLPRRLWLLTHRPRLTCEKPYSIT